MGVRTLNREVKILRALGGDTRFRLARLLLAEEVCVCELESILGISQPAVSQQLRILREAGLLDARREGNWVFYRIEPASLLEALDSVRDSLMVDPREGEGLPADLAALAEFTEEPMENCPDRIPRGSRPLTSRYPVGISFICTGNSCRSQMAEYFVRVFGDPGRVRAESSGLEPKGVHPSTIRVMGELGIDLSDAQSRLLDVRALSRADLAITLCGDARESCPVVPPEVQMEHWDLPDPAKLEGSEEEILVGFRSVRDDISRRVREMLTELDALVGTRSGT